MVGACRRPDLHVVVHRVRRVAEPGQHLQDHRNRVAKRSAGTPTQAGYSLLFGYLTATGVALNVAQYDEFGNGGIIGGVGWTGRERDGVSGLQYNRARWYDPSSGRWASLDPLGFDAGDANLYRYVGNSPTNATDPSGLNRYRARERAGGVW
jgi:RHS repeat-associated protein